MSRRRCAHERARGMNESPMATSESAGEGVVNWCPCVAESSWSHTHRHMRTESAGEGMANVCPFAAGSCCSHNHCQTRTGSTPTKGLKEVLISHRVKRVSPSHACLTESRVLYRSVHGCDDDRASVAATTRVATAGSDITPATATAVTSVVRTTPSASTYAPTHVPPVRRSPGPAR